MSDTTASSVFCAYNVKQFGAVGDGKTNDAAAFQKAIDAATAAGGGTVYVPPGNYLSGSIQFKSNVRFHVEAGALITGSPRREDYTSRVAMQGEGFPMRGACLIHAEDAVNVTLSGRGRIHGNGLAFCKKNELGVNVIADWRPGRMLRFIRCNNLLIEDITLSDSPGWTIHPIDCDGVLIRGITMLNGITAEDHVPNSDGIDPDGCSNVRISDCYLQSGDDTVCLKNETAGGSGVCSNITVTNCVCISTETALKIGSGTFGEFRNITFSNCVVKDAGCGVGLWMRDGGLIDGWTVNNIAMTLPHDGVPIYFWSWRREDSTPWGTVRNVMVSNVTAIGDGCVFMDAPAERPMEGITLENFRIFMRGGSREKFHADPPHPFQVWGHRRAPYDMFCRNVRDLKLRNIQIEWSKPEKPLWGSAVRCWNVEDLLIDGLEARQSEGSNKPVIDLRNVRNAMIRNCRPTKGASTFLQLREGTKDVALMNNDLKNAQKVVELLEVEKSEFFESGNRLP